MKDFLEEFKNPWLVVALIAMTSLIVLLMNVRISPY